MDEYECDVIGLFYDIETHRFMDEDGFIVWNIFEIITPNDVYLFRQKCEYMLVRHRYFKDLMVELYFPGEDF